MKTFIVFIPIENSIVDPRSACESIEAMNFKSKKYPDELTTAIEVRKKIMHELGINDPHNIIVEPISDFMDSCNNQEIDLDHSFLSYVYA